MFDKGRFEKGLVPFIRTGWHTVATGPYIKTHTATVLCESFYFDSTFGTANAAT